ncbi:hypothetical protein A3D78_05075 [Candidatus Gottesmanbacteria bacterium RIFCSPHIGHO2_02_FULL_39_14]|uniref:Membrane protein 6-pyruvoyl-tetrahydropterin synthase-related domain-containing protein n=1 Tax=Candidatus Gottesmanbacteria bacterium RIFCSPHIGHO2_02_FULL_39_14 TaxID=1798383 RepID=A0A1F5ZZX9_9BACT|nr:MAG: hypothetical protein A3D78_05075 [Candidatus Gottesmanbacteria bacterium RIFCSPHIGHO2_02_FULL_39_14]
MPRFLLLSIKLVLLPLIFYFIFFLILTYPLITRFSTHLFTDAGDGLQNVWNLWWVNKAITQLHTSPWYTNYLHYPSGTSLLAHTLNAFNGLLSIPLLKFFTLVKTHNIIVIFSFVMAGLTAFWLCWYFTKSLPASYIGGYIFTFSSYHFTHTTGLLQQVSLEWLPLFILSWYIFINKPSLLSAHICALTLFLLILVDYYFFFYSLLIGIILLIFHLLQKAKQFISSIKIIHIIVFITTFSLTSGVLLFSFFKLLSSDVLMGIHDAKAYSLDLLALFIPGGFWRFASLTKLYWSELSARNIAEESVYIGISVTILLVYLWFNRKKLSINVSPWYFILIFFAILSLGPVLHIWGKEIPVIPMPYTYLEKIIPVVKQSGVPIRMTVIVTLVAALLSSIAASLLLKKKLYPELFFLLLLLFIEYLPKQIVTTKPSVPTYIDVLKNAPGNTGIIDLVSDPHWSLYYQTIHQKPLAFGYISRLPYSVYLKDQEIDTALKLNDYQKLCQNYRIRYLLTPNQVASLKSLYDDGKVRLYDLGGKFCEALPKNKY